MPKAVVTTAALSFKPTTRMSCATSSASRPAKPSGNDGLVTEQRPAVVQLSDFRPPAPPPQRSQYELYPLPFFNPGCALHLAGHAIRRLRGGTVRPAGGSPGRSCGPAMAPPAVSSLLPQIVADMSRAGQVNGEQTALPGALGAQVDRAGRGGVPHHSCHWSRTCRASVCRAVDRELLTTPPIPWGGVQWRSRPCSYYLPM